MYGAMTSAHARLATGLAAAFLLLVFIEPAGSFSRQLTEGDRCLDRGVAGTCRLLQDCQQARRALQGGRTLPTRCGFVGIQEIICCTSGEDAGSAGGRDVRDNGVDSGYLEPGSSDGGDDDGERRPGSWSTHKPVGSHSLGGWNNENSKRRPGHNRDSVGGSNNSDEQPSSQNTRKPAGTSSLGSWSTDDTNKSPGYNRDRHRGNDNGDEQPGPWSTRKPASTSSLGSWSTDNTNRIPGSNRDSHRGNDNGDEQPGLWSTRKPAVTSSSGSWSTDTSDRRHSFLENDGGHKRDSQRGNDNDDEQPGSWDTRKPAGTSSLSSWNTPKPVDAFSSGSWNNGNTDSRDRFLENDSNDSRRRNDNAGDQLGTQNTREPAGTSSQRRTQACESYKNFRNGPATRILSGKNAGKQEFPHMAALGYQLPGKRELSWLCGGSLISDQYVLTAAHCCSSKERTAPVRVQLGTLNLTSSTAVDQRYGIREIFIHPSYSRPNYQGDIALIKLDRKVSWTDTVCPACLYSQSGDPQTGLVVTGWGATQPIGLSQSPVLLKSTIRPFPLLKCEQMYKERFPEGLDSSVMCAGDPEGKAGTCDGDSGGPLQIKESALIYSIVGITSIGPSPCGGTLPTLYTRVSSYVEWIEKNVWP